MPPRQHRPVPYPEGPTPHFALGLAAKSIWQKQKKKKKKKSKSMKSTLVIFPRLFT